MVLASTVHIAAWENGTFYAEESLQKTIFEESWQSLSNAPLHIAGLGIYYGKSVIVKSWNIVRGKTATVPKLE